MRAAVRRRPRRGPSAPLAALRAALDAARRRRRGTLRAGLADRALAEEIEPWLASHRAESERMRPRSICWRCFCADAPPMQRVFAFFRLEGMLSRIVPVATASYGPRRVLYPQLASLRDDEAAFGSDQALFVDRCLADALVRFAEETALRALSGPA